MKRTTNRPAERGFSLAEVLTATAIFAVIFVAALLLYDRSNRVFKQGVEAGDMQQNTRVAFDKVVADLRMTGFDFDRDGNPASSLANPWQPNQPYSPGNLVQPEPPNGYTYQATNSGTSVAAAFATWDEDKGDMTTEPGGTLVWENMGTIVYQQPDEQIEYAGPSAIVVRSNFDYDFETGPCPTANMATPCENGRERLYESQAFQLITTGNDEIVAYGLKPVTPPATPLPAMTFYADLTRPRNVHPGTRNKEQLVSIAGVDLCTGGCNNPPYVLYRFSWDDNGNIVETPLADNIRSINYRYFTDTAATVANEVPVLPLGAGQYDGSDPFKTVAERDTRTDIRAVRLDLVGMNPAPDGSYTDATDTRAPRHRKYQLQTVIVPRNIGRRGMREFTTTAPGNPTLNTLCVGSCNAAYLAWTAPQTGGDVETYNMLYDTDNCTSGFTYAEDAGRNVEGNAAQFITPGQTYFFAIQSINKFGTGISNCMSARVENKTRPDGPANLRASGGDDVTLPAEDSQIELRFPPATTNEDAKKTTTCNIGTRDEKIMPGAERRFYRIYRSTDKTVQPGAAGTTVVLDEFKITQPGSVGAEMSWIDNQTSNCQDYYYRIRVVDFCARTNTFNEGNDITIGESTAYFPLLAADGIRGRSTTVKQPAQPQGLAISNRVVSGATTDYTLVWGAVTKNEGDPTGPTIYVDKYRVQVRTKDPVTGWGAPTSQVVTGGALTYTFKTLPTPTLTNMLEHEFTVYAVTCSDSPASKAVVDPCTFGGVTPGSVSVAPDVAYGGNGTSGNPWVINDPAAFMVNSTVALTSVTVQFKQNGVSVGTATLGSVAANTATPVTIPSSAADGIITEATFSFTDSTGCSLSDVKYVIDEPPGSCTLRDASFTPAPTPVVQTFTPGGVGGTAAIAIHNTSALTLTIKRVIISWNSGNGSNRTPEQLTTVTFPVGSVTANCPTPAATAAAARTTVVAPPFAQQIAPNNFVPISVVFREPGGNQTINTGNPITKVCVEYQLSTGDILTCPIIPNLAATCTTPASNCQ